MSTTCLLHRIKKLLLFLGLLLIAISMYAQQFSVQRFRILPNDISAYIHSEKDLNDEACALIKIVCNRDFVFSTPLGIVERTNDVGEIWIYVPHGTVQITIKHPQWGVLRDYRLPAPLESRLTYELVINSPVTMPQRKIPPMKQEATHYEMTFGYPSQLPVPEWVRPKRPKEKRTYLLMLDASIHKQELAGGIRIGTMRRHGFYVHLLSNFQKTSGTQDVECDKNGIPEGSDIPPYYTGKTENSRYAFLVGGLHRVTGKFCIYEGIGYGSRTVTWETNEGNYIRNKGYSAKGFSAELGGMLNIKKLIFSIGALTTGGSYWEVNTGIGFFL